VGNGQPVVQIDEGFDRAWRRVGLTLDRTGFTVEDRDRSKGTYFVRYVEPNGQVGARLPLQALRQHTQGECAPEVPHQCVRSQGESTTVSVLNAAGAPENSANAQRIVNVIADDLK
jgi:outer membrane protein assembly factor BamC